MRKSLESMEYMVVYGKKHPDLPEKYREFETYLKDSGYSVMCIPLKFKEEALENPEEMWMYEAPIATRYFINNLDKLEEYEGYLIFDIPYDSKFGIMADSDFIEF